MIHTRIPVYLMPGMAAAPSIFQHINLPSDVFDVHFLEWFVPEKGISLEGMLVQEMTKHIKTRKVIIISSVKSHKELPKRMQFAKYTKIHKLLPTGLINNVELIAKYAFGETVTKRLELYEQYLSVRDKNYIDWAIDKIVNWKESAEILNLVHIHGDKDPVFPKININNCITVKNGTHTMIIHRYKWFNEHLPTIILQNESSI